VQISGPVVQDAGDGNIGQTGVTRSDSLRRFEITAKDGFSDRISEGWNMQKSAIEEIRELKAQIESKTEQVKTEALDKASEAVSFLRDLGLDNDAILKELGFRGPAPPRKAGKEHPLKMSLAKFVISEQTLPTTEERTAARQRRSPSRPKSLKKRD
jgi:hypothetical protein